VDSGLEPDAPGIGDLVVGPGQENPIPHDAPPGPCLKFAQEGASCAGGQVCPQGLQPATLGNKPCTCHVPCTPGAGQMCDPAECNRVCVQLVDSQQQPIPGMGVCVEDPGNAQGEPCQPSCKTGLICVAHGSEASFCRDTCTGGPDCHGYKMVCVPLQSPPGTNVCIPGGSTAGPQEGENGSDSNAFCVEGLICDPATETCVLACDPDSPTACTTPKTCAPLPDPGSGVLLGFGCRTP
jgi:hypothetical protein